jgi:hypothetical protein
MEKQTTHEPLTFQESDDKHPHQFIRHPFVDARGKKETTFSGQQLITFLESYESKQRPIKFIPT